MRGEDAAEVEGDVSEELVAEGASVADLEGENLVFSVGQIKGEDLVKVRLVVVLVHLALALVLPVLGKHIRRRRCLLRPLRPVVEVAPPQEVYIHNPHKPSLGRHRLCLSDRKKKGERNLRGPAG